MAAPSEKSATSCALIAVGLPEREGVINEGARRRMGLVVPHLRRAVSIDKKISLHRVKAAELANTIDGLAAGMFLVDPTNRIIRANARGHAMLTQGDVVRSADLRLSLRDESADQAMLNILAAAKSANKVDGVQRIRVPSDSASRHGYVVEVLPLIARGTTDNQFSAIAAVFVYESTIEGTTQLETIAQQFNLTARELSVLRAIVEIGNVPEVAPMLGISKTTVRTHLHHVFEKTRTKRQVDLIKLVAGFRSPLTGA